MQINQEQLVKEPQPQAKQEKIFLASKKVVEFADPCLQGSFTF